MDLQAILYGLANRTTTLADKVAAAKARYTSPEPTPGTILAGSTFGIPASVNVATLGLSEGGMMLAKALQDYGGIWRDSGGTSQCVFYSTPEMEGHPLIQQMRADGAKIMAVMSIMRNQAANNINGGGARRVPALPEVA